MELHQLIAQIAIEALKAKDQLHAQSVQKHERERNKLLDQLDEKQEAWDNTAAHRDSLLEELSYFKAENERLENLRLEHVAEIDGLRGHTTHSVEVVQSYERDLALKDDLLDRQDTRIDELKAEVAVCEAELEKQLREVDRVNGERERMATKLNELEPAFEKLTALVSDQDSRLEMCGRRLDTTATPR